MNYYDRFSPEVVREIIKLNEKLSQEEKENVPNKEKVLKLHQQILMKGLELSNGGIIMKNNPYI